jgi:hypothetical protein
MSPKTSEAELENDHERGMTLPELNDLSGGGNVTVIVLP